MRHDLPFGAWPRIARHAGVATTAEPPTGRQWAQDAAPNGNRGDILVVSLDNGLVVADVSVVHPAATKYVQTAAQIDGAAAAARNNE
jgi:hypothetical protein